MVVTCDLTRCCSRNFDACAASTTPNLKERERKVFFRILNRDLLSCDRHLFSSSRPYGWNIGRRHLCNVAVAPTREKKLSSANLSVVNETLTSQNISAAAAAGHHDAWLSEIGQGELRSHADKLVSLGIYRARDVQHVRESDLVNAGVPLVAARRLIAAAQRPPSEVSMMMRPQATLNAAAEAGLIRGQRSIPVIFVSSAMGGALLSFGGAMYVMAAGGAPLLMTQAPGLHKILSASVFPIGLSMVVFTGTDLLTSNMMYHTLPFLTHPDRNVTMTTMSKVMRERESTLVQGH